jgi:hypothetical protein
VTFEGPIANERLYDTMNEDDVLVVPSRLMADGERDGIPVVLIEALAAGVARHARARARGRPPHGPRALRSRVGRRRAGRLDQPRKRVRSVSEAR